ncbi:GNAT family N-acetyltransferase [Sulfurimonas sp. HSL1-2]|uniref:GNAT family N-acetyltransferase n=1 Tax=Thiomicrolovo zhangzhouensis TaxID=3131933 RepID=UPI0031F8F070
MNIQIVKADYCNEIHWADIPMLLDAYARDPMGGGQPLKETVKASLVSELAKRPYAFTVIAYADGKPAGLANCFEGFSTFACKPLVNIHDIAVLPEYRGIGISQKLLEKVEEIATEKGCCKITLEVLGNNAVAQAAYRKFGFAAYELDPAAGSAQFWEKKLDLALL